MNRWQELGLTPDEAQDEINDLTRENDTLRRERDEARALYDDLAATDKALGERYEALCVERNRLAAEVERLRKAARVVLADMGATGDDEGGPACLDDLRAALEVEP